MLTRSAAAGGGLGAVLRARLAGFPGFLRVNGFDIGAADAIRTLETAADAGILDPGVLRWNLKALLCGRADEWRRFDRLFGAYFLPPNRSLFAEGAGGADAARGAAGTQSSSDPPGPAGAQSASQAPNRTATMVAAHESSLTASVGGSGDVDTGAARGGASHAESLSSTNFRDLNRAEHSYAIEKLMRRFAKRLKQLQLRRHKASDHGGRLDLQATIRRSVSFGGTPLQLAWRQRRRVRPRLILLVDVSRSMSLYSFFYMRLARALCGELADAHCYIFHTRITDVGAALKDPDPWRSQERLHVVATGWAGGTRIGECLAEFVRGRGIRLVHSRTGVIIISDGYDTGEPALLAESLAVLRRRARRLIWINPLLSEPGYTPQSRGMQAALPHIDLLTAGADLASVETILPRLLEALR